MKGKGIIFCAVLIGVIFLCASAVSAASTNPTGTMVTAPKNSGRYTGQNQHKQYNS